MDRLMVTTVTPVYAGADYLETLVQGLDRLRMDWDEGNAPICLAESIFVIDAAIDDSLQVLDKLEQQFSFVKTINLSRNFGQHPATVAGILHSSGDWIVTLDEDLQHQPNKITDLFESVAESGADIVYARPIGGVHKKAIRDYGSLLFKKLMATLTGNKNIVDFNSFRLIRGSIARATASVCSHETYFDIALTWFTNNINSISIAMQDSRVIEGKHSGYTFLKLLSHSRKLLVSTHTYTLRAGFIMGAIGLGVSILYGSYITIIKIINPDFITIQGWSSLFVSILFFGGISLFLLGVILEYLSVVLLHTQGKPTFFAVDRSSDKVLQEYFRRCKNDNTF
jgi:glycosyltransferase involved in cell wall biosynthesis